ncbi:MAG TPA: hypothetical protein VGQ71_15105 [Terriglobales bacterium]|jgi:hypothetical protein|nr:hypothetical protein [Terriglobales bacterium]
MSETIPKSRLYRESFLPGAVNRLRNRVIVKVIGVRNDDHALDQIDRGQLIEVASAFMRSWAHAGGLVDAGLQDAVARPHQLVVQSPSEIYVSPYPLMLQCSLCKVLEFSGEADDERLKQRIKRRIRFDGGQSRIPCNRTGCVGSLRQVPYVVVHRCGSLQSMGNGQRFPTAQQIGFEDAGGSFFHNYYFDVDTGKRISSTALQENCPSCKKQYPERSKLNKRATPVPSGESFYSQTVQYIALSRQTGELVSQLHAKILAGWPDLSGPAADIAEGIASVLLGLESSFAVSDSLASMFKEQAVTVDAENIQAQINKLNSNIERLTLLGDMEDLVVDALQRRRKLEAQLGQNSGQFAAVRDILDHPETLASIVHERRALEAAFLRHDVKQRSFDDYVLCASEEHQLKLDADWKALKKRYGIQRISHITNLKVVLAAVGYSRERRAPDEQEDAPPVALNGFEDLSDPAMRGRRAMYAMAAETEAIWIRLDPCKVLEWCVRALGWELPSSLVMGDPTRAHAWLLTHSPALTMNPATVPRETKGLPVGEAAPFHLLHSIAHGLLATIRQHSGYDEKSVMEYLLPADLSFVLYVTSVQNFTAGGMVTLFENYLLNWFDDAAKYTFNCAFDPFCSEQTGACSGCIQRELACETMNHGLSRSYIHGGIIDGTVVRYPFWA